MNIRGDAKGAGWERLDIAGKIVTFPKSKFLRIPPVVSGRLDWHLARHPPAESETGERAARRFRNIIRATKRHFLSLSLPEEIFTSVTRGDDHFPECDVKPNRKRDNRARSHKVARAAASRFHYSPDRTLGCEVRHELYPVRVLLRPLFVRFTYVGPVRARTIEYRNMAFTVQLPRGIKCLLINARRSASNRDRCARRIEFALIPAATYYFRIARTKAKSLATNRVNSFPARES